MWLGTNIADGTCFLKVKFNNRVQSLLYSAKFEIAMDPKHFRVIQVYRQVRVCRMCLQPGHISQECPEFSCHKCRVQGHYTKECEQKQNVTHDKCGNCLNQTSDCTCNYSEDSEAFVESVEDLNEESEATEGEMEEAERKGGRNVLPSKTSTDSGFDGVTQRRRKNPRFSLSQSHL